ncbi:MAG TPA: sulfotransferase domain-containing protein [Allosphingosinicella sp.]|nr:sulfotransferase domain-containing protein [Allosphingosinicella sp.]
MTGLIRRLRDRLFRAGSPVIISYPKSGRTQLRVMLHAAGVEVPFSHAGSSEEQARPVEALGDGLRYWRRRRVLLMVRDPRDTLVSAWYQARHRSKVFEGDLSGFLRDPRHGIEKIAAFNLMWVEARAQFPAFTLVEYEEMQRHPAAAFRRVHLFLTGREASDEAVAAAIAAGRFDRMRALEESGEGAVLFGVRLRPGDAARPESYKTRRGIVGGWREELSAEDAACADEVLAQCRYWERLKAARGG